MPIKKERLNYETLGKFKQGLVAALVNTELAKLFRDCDDRPTDATKRKLTLELEFSPIPDATCSRAEAVTIAVAVSSKTPKMKSREYQLMLTTEKDQRNNDMFVATYPVEDGDDPEMWMTNPAQEGENDQ